MIRGWQDTHASQTHSRVLATQKASRHAGVDKKTHAMRQALAPAAQRWLGAKITKRATQFVMHTLIHTHRLDALENPGLSSLITVCADAEVDFLLGLCKTDSRIQHKEEMPD